MVRKSYKMFAFYGESALGKKVVISFRERFFVLEFSRLTMDIDPYGQGEAVTRVFIFFVSWLNLCLYNEVFV